MNPCCRPLSAMLLALACCSGADGRPILVASAADVSPVVRAAIDALTTQADRVPLLDALRRTQHAGIPTRIDSAMLVDDKAWKRAAEAHLVVIGTPGRDGLLDKVWGHQVRVDAATRTVAMEGYGRLTGDLGVVFCDRNPFLHSPRVDTSPRDACLMVLSGTSDAGIVAAIDAFRGGLANGIVPAGAMTRPQASILDLDPSLDPPPARPDLGTARFAGWTQCAANEYRAFLDVADAEPQRLWRLKWLEPDAWEGMGAKPWLAGMHRMAFGNAANCARFADAVTAARVAAAIGKGGRESTIAGCRTWELAPPTDEAIDAGDVRPTLILARGGCVVMATIDRQQLAHLVEALPR